MEEPMDETAIEGAVFIFVLMSLFAIERGICDLCEGETSGGGVACVEVGLIGTLIASLFLVIRWARPFYVLLGDNL